jgi:hypothetical protein
MFTNQHVDLSSQLVASQPTELIHNWNVTPQQYHITETGTNILSLPPLKAAHLYPIINDVSCRPSQFFPQYSSTSLPAISIAPSHLTVPSLL